MKRVWIGVIALVLIVGAAGVAYAMKLRPKNNSDSIKTASSNTDTKLNESAQPKESRARLGVVGDLLIHDTIYKDMQTGRGYDFRPAFKDIKPFISRLEFAAANEETILGGTALGLSGLYVANTPQEAGDTYRDTGFNIIQTANNHAFDKGLPGLTNTLKYWDNHQDKAITSGTARSQAERDKIKVISANGIKLAFLAYSYGSNIGGIPHSYNLNVINKDLMKKDIARARAQADVVMVGVHWGIEQDLQPSGFQKDIAQFLALMGVDVVYGTHPHVLQAPEWLYGPHKHKTYVMYSLGNFLSNDTIKPPQTLTGAVMGLDIVKQADGVIKLENPYAMLTWNYFTPQDTGFRVIPWDRVKDTEYPYGNWDEYVAGEKVRLSKNVPDLEFTGSKSD